MYFHFNSTQVGPFTPVFQITRKLDFNCFDYVTKDISKFVASVSCLAKCIIQISELVCTFSGISRCETNQSLQESTRRLPLPHPLTYDNKRATKITTHKQTNNRKKRKKKKKKKKKKMWSIKFKSSPLTFCTTLRAYQTDNQLVLFFFIFTENRTFDMRWRQFAWTFKFCFLVCFLEKERSIFPNVNWNLYPEYLASKQKHFRLTVKSFKLQAARGECATYVHTIIKALNSFHTLYEPQRHKTSENVHSDLCAQRGFRSVCAVAVWSDSSQSVFWIVNNEKLLHANNVDYKKTVWMCGLIWDYVRNTCWKVRFLTFRFILYNHWYTI